MTNLQVLWEMEECKQWMKLVARRGNREGGAQERNVVSPHLLGRTINVPVSTWVFILSSGIFLNRNLPDGDLRWRKATYPWTSVQGHFALGDSQEKSFGKRKETLTVVYREYCYFHLFILHIDCNRICVSVSAQCWAHFKSCTQIKRKHSTKPVGFLLPRNSRQPSWTMIYLH